MPNWQMGVERSPNKCKMTDGGVKYHSILPNKKSCTFTCKGWSYFIDISQKSSIFTTISWLHIATSRLSEWQYLRYNIRLFCSLSEWQYLRYNIRLFYSLSEWQYLRYNIRLFYSLIVQVIGYKICGAPCTVQVTWKAPLLINLTFWCDHPIPSKSVGKFTQYGTFFSNGAKVTGSIKTAEDIVHSKILWNQTFYTGPDNNKQKDISRTINLRFCWWYYIGCFLLFKRTLSTKLFGWNVLWT